MSTTAQGPATDAMVNWDVAIRVGARLAGNGPDVSWAEAAAVVENLRADAQRSTPLVREFTGLTAQAHTAPILVVDRAGWVQANAEAFSQVLAPVVAKLSAGRGKRAKVKKPRLTDRIGSRVTGAEVGVMLGFLGSKVLGQFDPFHATDSSQGRLLLVAPNVVEVERQLEVVPADFRLWVCLHEETHRVQFTAVPWMRDHLFSLVDELTESMGSDPMELISQALSRAGEVFTGKGEGNLLNLMASEEQRAVIDKITGVMSLLEGHADVVMDGVGPEVIPSVKQIRKRFNQRRKGVGTLDRLLRRLLGLDQKMAQYRDGAVFVRHIVDQVGMDGFNAVFAEPDHLPSKAEILAPETWLARVQP